MLFEFTGCWLIRCIGLSGLNSMNCIHRPQNSELVEPMGSFVVLEFSAEVSIIVVIGF